MAKSQGVPLIFQMIHNWSGYGSLINCRCRSQYTWIRLWAHMHPRINWIEVLYPLALGSNSRKKCWLMSQPNKWRGRGTSNQLTAHFQAWWWTKPILSTPIHIATSRSLCRKLVSSLASRLIHTKISRRVWTTCLRFIAMEMHKIRWDMIWRQLWTIIRMSIWPHINT